MSVAPYAGVVALDNFKSPTASEDGLQGQVPKPLAGQQTYILSASGWISGGGGSGTVTSVDATVPAFLSVSGVPITASGTITITYSGTALPVANGGTGVTTSTGSGSVVLSTSPSLTTPTQASYEIWTSTAAPSYAEGRLWFDSAQHSLSYYNDSATAPVHIGQDLQLKVINNTGSTIANGAPVYLTGTSSGQTYPNIALAKADVSTTAAVVGLTNGAIANGAIGYVTLLGGIDKVNTGTFTVGQVLYLSPYSAGQLQNSVPPTGLIIQVGTVTYVDSTNGKINVKQSTPLTVATSTLTGQVAIANGGTGQSTKAAGFNALSPMSAAGDVIYGGTSGAGTALAIGTAGQVLTVNAGATAPVWAAPATSGTVTSVSGTGTVSGISLSGTVTSSGNLTLGGTLDLSSPPAIGGTAAAAGSFTTLIGGSGSANYEQITGGATTKAVQFQTLGTDANISVAVQPKGTGAIDLAAGSSGVNISNGGTVTAITRTAGGTGYTVAPTVNISAPTTAGGTQATATCTVTAGVVDTTFTITNAGSGYVEQPTITFTPVSGGSGAAAYATVGSDASIKGIGPNLLLNSVSGTQLQATDIAGASPIAWWGFTGTNASTGTMIQRVAGGGTNTTLAFVAKGTGSIQFATANTAINVQFQVSNTASAVNYVQITGSPTNPTASTGASILFTGSDAAVSGTIIVKGTSSASTINFAGNGSANYHAFRVQTQSSVNTGNLLQVQGAAAGSAPSMQAVSGPSGTDANIDITLTPKGTGRVNITTSIKPKVNSVANVTSPLAWDSTSYDEYAITALANALTINADANASPADGQRMMFRFKDNGTARALTWTTGSTNSFRVVGVTLPTTTVASKLVYIGCVYNAADSRWDAVAVSQEA